MWGDGSHCREVSKSGRVMAKGETSRAEPGLSFHEVVGTNIGVMDSSLLGGSRITKINGCLERCKERPKLVIPFEMIAEDVEYYSKHSFVLQVSRFKSFSPISGELGSKSVGTRG